MKYKIKKIRQEDLKDIYSFYNELYNDKPFKIKSLELLRWLFSDPLRSDDFCGFVARDEANKVVGIIGYALNEYQYMQKKYTGVVPMSWLVSPSARGILGIQLLLKALKLGDFAFTIHGSKIALEVYHAVNLKYVTQGYAYTKVLNIIRYIKSDKKSFIKAGIRSLIYHGRIRSSPGIKGMKITEYRGEPSHSNVNWNSLSIVPTNERNQWILGCPIVESFSFSVIHHNKTIGTCICYIHKDSNDIKRGRIVSIPNFGNDLIAYRFIISELEKYLHARGCCVISVLALNGVFRIALRNQGYRTLKRISKVFVFLRDPEKILKFIPISEWHLMHYEKDLGFQGF